MSNNSNEIEKINVSDSVQTDNNLFMLNDKIYPKFNNYNSEKMKNNEFFHINSYNNKNNNYFFSSNNNIEFQNQLINEKIEKDIIKNKRKNIKKIKIESFIKDNLNLNSSYNFLNSNLNKNEKNNNNEIEKNLSKELKFNNNNNNIDKSEYLKKDYPNNKLLSIYEIKFDNCFKNYKLKNNFRNRLKSLSTISIFNKNPEKKKIKSFHKNLSALQTFINSNNNKNNKNINYIKSIYNDCISFGNNNNKNFQNQIEETKIFNIKNKLKIINKKRNNIHNFPLNGINIKNISYSNNNSYKNIHKEFKKRNKIINRNLPTSELYYKNQKNKLILFPNSMIISNNKKTSNSNNNSINKEQKKLENKTNNNSYNYKSQSTISYLPYLSKIGIKKLKLNN